MQQTEGGFKIVLAISGILLATYSGTSAPVGFYTVNQNVNHSIENSHGLGIVSGLDSAIAVNFSVESPENIRIDAPTDRVLEPGDFQKNYYTGSGYAKAHEFRFTSRLDEETREDTSFSLEVGLKSAGSGEGVEGDLEFSREILYTVEGSKEPVDRGFSEDDGDEDITPDIITDGGQVDETENQEDAEKIQETNETMEDVEQEEGSFTFLLAFAALISVVYLLKVVA
jgi:hypothetical protein